ncbi:hypothetical protein H5410_058918 [Solanum commersonii]|uniref:Uncharacterized protein n=1 Tax=Solanum commersonii TaxID=4109 RepID=A0A9J5W1C7_SOLCO|nr:hypothetical protein H5410_058918 [Solanum commersonii]
MEIVYLEGQTGPFSIHEFLVIRNSKNCLPKIFTVVRYDLINVASWSRVANGAIFMYKRAPKQEKSDFTNICVL